MSLIRAVSVRSPLCPGRGVEYRLPRVELEGDALGNAVWEEALVSH